MWFEFVTRWLPPGLTGSLVAGFFALVCFVGSAMVFRLAYGRITADRSKDIAAHGLADTSKDIAAHGPGYDDWLGLLLFGLVLLIAGVVLAASAISPYADYRAWIIAYAFVFCFGGAVGAAELVSRYRDNPGRALLTAPALFYVSLNAFGSIAALYLIYIFRAKLGFAIGENKEWSPDPGHLVQAVLIAGFSSLLFFRTSLFKFRVGDSDLAIGPSIVLDTLLGAADRAVDRVMADPRATFVHGLMKSIAFEKAAVILPSHCLALMQNVSSEESQRIGGLVNKLRTDKEMPDKIKALNLGLALLSVVGTKVLRTAVEGLRKDLEDSTAKLVEEVGKVMESISFEPARRMLPQYCFAIWPRELAPEVRQKLVLDVKALSELEEVPDDYKSLLLGIWLARLTDGDTLRKAVLDLSIAIKISPHAALDQAPSSLRGAAAGEARGVLEGANEGAAAAEPDQSRDAP